MKDNETPEVKNGVQRIDNYTILTNAHVFDRLTALSNVMANSGALVPAHFQGKPDACMAVAMQAARWGLDPFAVAQKTHIVNGSMGYEAQLVNAVINTMAPTKNRLSYEWYGQWEKILGKTKQMQGSNGKPYISPDWNFRDEAGLGVRVWATMKGEDKPRVLEILLTQAQVRNSTLWASDPRQQLAYLACKRWARLHCPEVILGVYSPDEFEEPVERHVNPARATVDDVVNSAAETQEGPLTGEVVEDTKGLEITLQEMIDMAADVDAATAAGNAVKEKKSELGVSAFNRLHAEASGKYRRLYHEQMVKTAINSLREAGTPEGLESLEYAEKVLKAARRHIGDQLWEGYSITLGDIAPEYR